ncbi:MAG: MFS transporter [Alphaproteobacteria bacterium]
MNSENYTETTPTIPRTQVWPIALITITISGFSYSLGLTYTVISLVLESRGYNESQIGLNGTLSGLGIFVSSMLVPKLAGWIGYRKLVIASALGSAVLIILLPVFDSFVFWCFARFGMGFLVTGIFVGGEAWLNEMSEDRYRGRVMGIYAMVTAGGFAAGPFTVGLVGIDSFLPFAICAGVLVICALSVTPLSGSDVKPSDHLTLTQSIMNLPKVAALIPTLTFAILTMAYFEAASHSLMPAYFSSLDFDDTKIGLFIGLLFIGAIPAMPLVGWLGDRFDSRDMLTVMTVLSLGLCLLFPAIDFRSWAVYPFLTALGAVIFGTYTLALTEMGNRFKGAALIAAMSGASIAWGIGSTVGPYTSGWAMKQFGNNALPMSFAIIYSVLLLIALYRRKAPKKVIKS